MTSGGYGGFVLDVNLSDMTMELRPTEEALCRTYLGGLGFASKILFDIIRPGTDAFSEDNALVFAVGPLTGTMFPQASRYVVAGRNALTDGWGEAHSGGFWGPELKLAGIDVIIIRGRASRPVFISIAGTASGSKASSLKVKKLGDEKSLARLCERVRDCDITVFIEDACKIWGMTTFDSIGEIRRGSGDPRTEVIAIGPAGERLVRFACILTGNGRVAARSGMGAVMGSKNLKAIAVRGTKGIDIACPSEYIEAVRIWYKKVVSHPFTEGRVKYGTTELVDLMNAIGRLPTYNLKQGIFEKWENISCDRYRQEYFVRPIADYACLQRCGRFVRVSEGEYKNQGKGPEFECLSALGSRCGNDRLDSIIYAHHLCDEFGMDTIGCGGTIAWAMECFEEGLLSRDECDGLELRWGNHRAIVALVEKIARREGIGALLAEGSLRAAKRLGRGSEKFVMHVKGQEIAGQEPRAQKSMGLAMVVSPRGADHLYAFPVLDEGSVFEKDIRQWYGDRFMPEIGDRLSPVHKGYMIKHNEDYAAVIESLGVCKYGTMVPPALYYDDLIEAIRVTMGWEISREELQTIGERIVNLNRLFNIREGLSRKDDSLPKRLTEEPAPEGVPKGHVVEVDEMLDEYYGWRGWDAATGYPTIETIQRLGLEMEGKAMGLA